MPATLAVSRYRAPWTRPLFIVAVRFGALLAVAALLAPMLAHASGSFEPQTDRLGSDYHAFFVESADPYVCQDACVADAKCHAWTWVRPGLQGELSRCWLKNPAPEPQPSDCCVSGLVRGATALPPDPTAPLANPPGSVGGDQIRDENWTWSFSQWRNERGRVQGELALGLEIGEEVILRANCAARSGSPIPIPVELSGLVDDLPPGAPISVMLTANDRLRQTYQGEVYDGPVGKTALIRLELNDPMWDAFSVSGGVAAQVEGSGTFDLLRTFYAERVGQFIMLCRDVMGE